MGVYRIRKQIRKKEFDIWYFYWFNLLIHFFDFIWTVPFFSFGFWLSFNHKLVDLKRYTSCSWITAMECYVPNENALLRQYISLVYNVNDCDGSDYLNNLLRHQLWLVICVFRCALQSIFKNWIILLHNLYSMDVLMDIIILSLKISFFFSKCSSNKKKIFLRCNQFSLNDFKLKNIFLSFSAVGISLLGSHLRKRLYYS